MESISGVISSTAELISALAWPIVILIVYRQMKLPLKNLLARSKSVSLKLPNGGEVTIEGSEVEIILQDILSDLNDITDGISEAERTLLTRIYLTPSLKEVSYYFPDFDRESADHQLLRKLKNRRLIDSKEGDMWCHWKHPEITNFGRFVLKHRSNLLLDESLLDASTNMANKPFKQDF
jgi:hypothetical protein